MNALAGRAASLLVALAMAIIIIAIAIVPLLTPQWVAFEQSRSGAAAWTGFNRDELRSATDSILSDLVIGPPSFDVTVRGVQVLDARERGHMRDVRTVFTGLWLLSAGAVVILLLASRRSNRAATWGAIRAGAIGLAAAVVVLGGVALVAFDSLFTMFHEVLFPAGSYDFDPATERLVQLFPFQFWQETAIVAGALIVVLCVGVTAATGRRARGGAHALPMPGEVVSAREARA